MDFKIDIKISCFWSSKKRNVQQILTLHTKNGEKKTLKEIHGGIYYYIFFYVSETQHTHIHATCTHTETYSSTTQPDQFCRTELQC